MGEQAPLTADNQTLCIAFEGSRRIAAGDIVAVALATKQVIDRGETAPVLIFDETTSTPIEIDFRGTLDDVQRRLGETKDSGEPAPRAPGRPKLGVVGREVTLLPRHWDWLRSQPGGASVTLRKIVEHARRASAESDKLRLGQGACYGFIQAMAGNLPNFEDASRALFAGDRDRFEEMVDVWPDDIRDHTHKLAKNAF